MVTTDRTLMMVDAMVHILADLSEEELGHVAFGNPGDRVLGMARELAETGDLSVLEFLELFRLLARQM